jgi:predicted RNA-binding protein with PUA-like domain
MRRNWLLKTEAVTYSIDDLQSEGVTRWDGVRNYQARNYMRDGMGEGDRVLIYHSNGKAPGIVGLAEISDRAKPDQSQFDGTSQYFDKKASTSAPIWYSVGVKFVKKFSTELPLGYLHTQRGLEGMVLLKKGSRLSIQPVSDKEFETILELESQAKSPYFKP